MVVDTSALVCILLAAAEAEDFARAIANAPENVIGAPTWVEASMAIAARLGSEGHALLLERSRVTVVPSMPPWPALPMRLGCATVAGAMPRAGILIQPLPVWQDEWEHPGRAANPRLIANIAREGIRL
jgi:hypothetical protein